MNHLLAILGLGLLCACWVLLQRWIARLDPDIGDSRHCGGGCCGDKLRDIERSCQRP